MKFYCQNSMQINDIQFKHHYFIDFAERKITSGYTPKIVIILGEGRHISCFLKQNNKVYVLKSLEIF